MVEAARNFPPGPGFYGIDVRKSELRCFEPADIKYLANRSVREFCNDADRSFCSQQSMQGKCVRMDRYRLIYVPKAVATNRGAIKLMDLRSPDIDKAQ